VACVGVDTKVGIWQVLGEEVAVLGKHRCAVVAIGDEGRLGDARQAVELGGVRDSPGCDSGELSVPGGPGRPARRAGLPTLKPAEELRTLRGAGPEPEKNRSRASLSASYGPLSPQIQIPGLLT
jgi:hypothetical protein